jgi:hypothetical protein
MHICYAKDVGLHIKNCRNWRSSVWLLVFLTREFLSLELFFSSSFNKDNAVGSKNVSDR